MLKQYEEYAVQLVRSSEFGVRSKIFKHRTPNTEHRTKKSRQFVIATGVFIWFLAVGISCVYAQDKIVAIVNNEAITQKDLNDFVNFTRMQLSSEYSEPVVEKRIGAMKKDLLDKLIEDRLILQEAQRQGLRIDENRIQGRINEIKRHYPQEAEFQKSLAQQGLVQADLERKVREQMLMFAVVEQNVKEKIIVRPDEVTDFYHNNKKEFVSDEERECDIIILDTDNEAMALAFENKVRSQERWEDLEKEFPLRVDKILLKRDGGLRQDIEDKICSLEPGELSSPVKVGEKYYIFRLLKIEPSKKLTLTQVQARIHAYLFETKMQEQFPKWLEELRKKAYIKMME